MSISICRATADRDDRPVRLGQVVARVRHDLCRGPAALRREPVRLCAPVSRDDAEAGRRSDRRPVAGHLHRAEDDVAAIPRSTVGTVTEIYDYHAPALCARRRPLFAGHRPADRKPDDQPDGRSGAGARRRHAASTSSRRSYADARASTARSWPTYRRRASSGSRSMASSTRSRTCRRSTRNTSTTSTSSWTASSCAPTSRRGWRIRWRRR